jgi:hypothetical protein
VTTCAFSWYAVASVNIFFSIPGTWHDAYDCELEEAILFEIIPHVLPADNPQQSETASHIGMAGNLGCRKDLNGGPKAYQETDEGYEAFYNVRIFFYLRPKNSVFNLLQPGEPRDKEVTVQTICWQVWNACGGNKTVLDASYSQTGIKDKISQYWIQRTLEMGKGFRAIQITDPQTRDPRTSSWPDTYLWTHGRRSDDLELLRRPMYHCPTHHHQW